MADKWEKIVDGARDVAGTVAEAAGDIYGKGKEFVNLKRIEWQLRDRYCKLGKLQYQIEINADANPEEKEELIANISKLREDLKRSGGREQKSGYMVCESCKSSIPDDSKFCPGCGKQL